MIPSHVNVAEVMLGRSGEDDPDALLLQRIARRDRAALAELYCRTSGSLRGVAYAIVADSAEAEDVVQEVFIVVWSRARLFESNRGNALAWLASIARRRAIDHWRTKVRRNALPESFVAEETSNETAGLGGDAPDRARDVDDHHVVRCAVAALPVEMGRVIDAVYFRGLSHAEVAASMGEPLGTIKARVRRGLLRLRTLLTRVGFEHYDRIRLTSGIEPTEPATVGSANATESPKSGDESAASDQFTVVDSPNSRETAGSDNNCQNEESA